MGFYKDLDLSYYTNDLMIKDIHLKKYQSFLTMILMQSNNELTICKKQIEDVFSENFFHQIVKDINLEVISAYKELDKERFQISSTKMYKIDNIYN